MTREELRKNFQEPEVKGLSIPWTEPGQEIFFRFSHSQEEAAKFGPNTAYYGTDIQTGETIKFWSTLGLKQAFADQNVTAGDVCIVKFIEQVGQFKRFALAVEHHEEGEDLPF